MIGSIFPALAISQRFLPCASSVGVLVFPVFSLFLEYGAFSFSALPKYPGDIRTDIVKADALSDDDLSGKAFGLVGDGEKQMLRSDEGVTRI